jgi:dCTP diphosphatase
MSISSLQQALARFADARDWGQFHDPKNLILALAGEVGELAELFQWLTPSEAKQIMNHPASADRVREELADVLGYVLRLATVLDVDLERAVLAKIEINNAKYPVEKAKGSAAKYTDLPE